MMVAWLHIFNIEALTRFAQHAIERGSYVVLFGLLFGCGLGMPLPEDIPLLVAGALVAKGKMHLAGAALCAWCGIIGGDCVLYTLGKIFGLEVQKMPVVGRHLSTRRIEQVHRMFERWGVWVVAIGRMFAGIRGAMVVVAGAIRFTFWKFFVADGLAAIVSGGLFLALGYLFGSRMHWLMQRVHEGKKWALLGTLVLVTGITIWALLRRHFHGERTEGDDAEKGIDSRAQPRAVRPSAAGNPAAD